MGCEFGGNALYKIKIQDDIKSTLHMFFFVVDRAHKKGF